ncbi:hypothetical protein OIU79_020316 [Salix purpurea]|uniref:Uncharacterized protein n=1 Tax=Salix purpurea TaxID=77065 RepID=A0A9Q0SL17_SALPP|nr:hypothetical protein OIU79_020316 [Salix purpurea]
MLEAKQDEVVGCGHDILKPFFLPYSVGDGVDGVSESCGGAGDLYSFYPRGNRGWLDFLGLSCYGYGCCVLHGGFIYVGWCLSGYGSRCLVWLSRHFSRFFVEGKDLGWVRSEWL